MRPRDLALRFVFGAVISAAAAVIGLVAGNAWGGILFGFPAILPASLTLIEKRAGRHEAAVDATGAILGSIALVAFAAVAAVTITRMPAALGLAIAGAAWLLLALGLYVLTVRLLRP